MAHRIREAMRAGGLVPPMGGNGMVVEADETYFGRQEEPYVSPQRKGRPFVKRGFGGLAGKRAVVALVERGGSVRSFHVAFADKATINNIVSTIVDRESALHTDESRLYSDMRSHVASHETVKHSVHGTSAARFIRTRSKACSRSSSAARRGSINTPARSTCIGTWPSSISATTIGSRWVSPMPSGHSPRSRPPKASG